MELDGVEGDDDDDDLWDGWGEEATTQDVTQSQITTTLSSDIMPTNSYTSIIADEKKKGGVDYKNDYKYDSKHDSKYDKNNTDNKKKSKNGKDGESSGMGKGSGSACKPVSSRAQQQQKRKEIKALKFDREKAKRLETIMIKTQKLQVYEEEKKLKKQDELDKKDKEEKLERFENEKVINNNEVEEKVIEEIPLIQPSNEIKMTPLSVTTNPHIQEILKNIKTEEKDREIEIQKKNSVVEVMSETVEVDEVLVKDVVEDVVKEVVKEVELSDGDSDGIEEEDDEYDIDPELEVGVEVEVEVGAKNVLTPSSAQEDDDDALMKRRTLGQGFLRDIMAEYNRDSNSTSTSSSTSTIAKDTKASSLDTSKTTITPLPSSLPLSLPLPLCSSVVATIRATDLGSDPRLSELLGALAASQQSCLKLWSPKKVSENAYTKVSVRF